MAYSFLGQDTGSHWWLPFISCREPLAPFYQLQGATIFSHLVAPFIWLQGATTDILAHFIGGSLLFTAGSHLVAPFFQLQGATSPTYFVLLSSFFIPLSSFFILQSPVSSLLSSLKVLLPLYACAFWVEIILLHFPVCFPMSLFFPNFIKYITTLFAFKKCWVVFIGHL